MYPKNTYRSKKKKPGHVYYGLDSIATANGEVGIRGSRSSPCEDKTFSHAKQGGARDSIRFHPVYVVNNFNFKFNEGV
jgi:hypothetical protein